MFESARTLDIPFARKVLEHLIAHPEEHDQHYYGQKTICGTRACIAGTAVLMDSAVTARWDHGELGYAVDANGVESPVDYCAQRLLGLNSCDAVSLFYDYDNASALNRLANCIHQAEQVQSQ